ncbi:MAG: glycosyltransferase family 2 protein [Anaerolineales bacterium]|nr:MAG: glycosyltransferase family 2 protein [Anaerolineales bacterium]
MKITAIILTKNEAKRIEPCIRSLDWCDEVVVFDSFSTDGTQALARNLGARVIENPFVNFTQQRNAALALVASDWTFFVDADEVAESALAQEIPEATQNNAIDVWWVPRHNYIFGKLTRGAGYYPDYQLRLLRKGSGVYEREASEIFIHQGKEGYLQGHLIHYNYENVAQFHEKQRTREVFEAKTLHDQGVRMSYKTLLVQPFRHFWWRYITLKGYQDGWHGFRLSLLLAYYFGFRNYLRLGQMRRAGQLPLPPA